MANTSNHCCRAYRGLLRAATRMVMRASVVIFQRDVICLPGVQRLWSDKGRERGQYQLAVSYKNSHASFC